jgi:CIC family chloride channel protein
MDTRELARFGLLHNRDRNILTLMHTSELIETDFAKVSAKASIMELLHIIAHSKRNLFPVVDSDNNLLGVISLESIRELLFELENYKEIPAVDLMSQAEATVELNEEMSSVMKKFDETGAWNLPVVNNRKYVGFVSKSSIFTKYRDSIIKSTVER